MFQIYTEEVPFHQVTHPVQVMSNILHGVLPLPPSESTARKRGLSDGMWALMIRCWKYEPRERPQMMEVREEITALLNK